MSSRTITTEATASCDAHPDNAQLKVTAIRKADSAAVARETAGELAAEIRQALTESTIARECIQTEKTEVEAASQMMIADSSADYRATEHMVVKCAPETAGDVVTTATDVGGSVPTVEFGIDADVQQRLRQEALDAAMDKARQKADRLAAAGNLEITGVRTIDSTVTSGGMSSIVSDALGESGGETVTPTAISVSESVEVVFDVVDRESTSFHQ